MTQAAMTGCVDVIDDDADVRGSIGSLLRSEGHRVRLFDSPAAYLAAEASPTACCLVLDIRLSGENGLDFQERLVTQARAVPVVLITGHGDIPMTVRGMRAGAVDVLPKPFADDQLLEAVARALAADKVRRADAEQTARLRAAYDTLTPREREVMGLVVTGLMNKQVAGHLGLSEITVKIHRGQVMRKMAAQSLADLVRMAEHLGIRDEGISRYSI
ncbi:MAG: DNA-binding response regulator [Maritimibacter sp.]|nr:DNA-binding response regulator [Maritimibacter sp.]